MRELLILLLLGACGYLAYDDYYKQRPALQQAQTEIQQLRQNPPPVAASAPRPVYEPITRRTPPEWFQKQLEPGSSLDSARRHHQPDPSRP